jgi:mannitol/fructose-specific phosphotransferase system IIA component (Ntr-type)
MPQPDPLAALLDPARVVVLPGSPSKALVIAALADLAIGDLAPHDRVTFIRSALEREDVTTTAIGNGVAIPHTRTAALQRCRVAIGVMPGGVAWGAADGRPVQLAVLIAARESDHSEHLRLMASIAMRVRRPGLADAVAGCQEREAVVRLLAG